MLFNFGGSNKDTGYMLDYLVGLGLYKDVLGAAVAVVVAHVFAWRPWKRFKDQQKQHQEELVQQMDARSTQTLRIVVDELAQMLAEREHPHG